MLSPMEKHGCQQILDLLSDEDVFALVGASTNYTVKADSRSEAENAVLSFAQSAEELLNRRRISKAILIKYCWTAAIPISGTDSKPVVVTAIINYWVQREPQKRSPLVSPPRMLGFEQNRNESSSSAYRQAPVSLSTNKQQVTIVQNVFNVGSINETHNQTLTMLNMGSQHNQTPTMSNTGSLGNADQTIAESFVKWFYEMLNAYHPAMGRPGESFGPQHFWANAQLFLLMVSSGKKEEESVVGAEKVAGRLIAIPATNHILFNPNVNSQGVTVRSTCHGAKLVLVCGTLHQAADCCGIFQQSFALVSNPLSPGSWKVKVTCLKMDQCAASTLPTLVQCQEIQAIEAHTMRALELSATAGPS